LILRIAALLTLASTLSYGAADDAASKKSTAAHAKKTTTSKTAHKSTSHAKTTAKSGKTTAKKGSSSKTASRRGKGSRSKSAQTWRSRQLAPTPDRYKEIQSALAERGYLKKDPSGVWDTESTDAMRRFQHDQNLESTGKLNSLSLMALGLGAKHGSASPAAPARTTPPTSGTPAPIPAPAVITPQNSAPAPIAPPPAAPADADPGR
jgi:hypothetical protein